MKLKNNFFYTLREDAKDEDSISSNLLVRSGMIKKVSSGIYMFMPLGYKVLKNIEQIIRDEMNKAGAFELFMPTMLPVDVFERSGRLKIFGDSIFKTSDRYHKKYILGPTHEEFFAVASSMKIKSYKDLPFILYQFQTKFRDEARPRYGLIRVREFIMKDAYSFDTDYDGLDISYQKMYNAYKAAFDRMGLNYKIVTADTGAMGGLLSEEFQAITDIGEDTLVLCDKCDYASNIEVSECAKENIKIDEKLHDKKLVETKDIKTITDVALFLDVSMDKIVKTLIYNIDGKLYACLVKGNDEVNETKVRKLFDASEIILATPEEVTKATNAMVGFAGPIGLKIPVIIDQSILTMSNFVVGANKDHYHYKDVNINDFEYDKVADIKNVKIGDICPKCGGKIYFKKGIEIGNTFKLGTKYSEAMNVNYLDQNNELHPVVMGSYGIGPGRIMASLVEQKNDDNGIIWPMSVAPYKVAIVLINTNDDNQMSIANKLYDKLSDMGIECLLDDRDERPGVKFNDMDLIGIPIRITVGKKAEDDIVEFKLRDSNVISDIKINKIADYINDIINKE